MQLLLCTNGTPTSRPALEYGVWLAKLLGTPVTLLAVIEDPTRRYQVERLLEQTAKELSEADISCQRQMLSGRSESVIPAQAAAGEYLTVVSPLGRPSWLKLFRGHSVRRLLAAIENPLLFVPTARTRLNRLLIAMGGLGYAKGAVQLGGRLAQAAGASVTLLHVIEPVTFDYPVALEIQSQWERLLETDIPQARHLRQALDDLQRTGLTTSVRIRHGQVRKEILSEIRQGDYDLVGVGSHYAVHGLRQLYTPNVTAEVAEAAGRPVLVVRYAREL